MSNQSARRVERSCAICHRRKVRCDKQCPCNQCIRGGHTCSYPPPLPNIRRSRKTTMNDVADRISELEKTISVVSREHNQSRSTAASSRFSPPKTSPVDAQSTGGTTEYEGESRNSNDEVLLKEGSSSQYFNEVLLSRVIERVFTIHSYATMILHAHIFS